MYFHDITVFKSDEDVPQLMDENERYNVDVIVSAAPQVMRINPDLLVLEPIILIVLLFAETVPSDPNP